MLCKSCRYLCKKFRGNRHNREAISVRAVWLNDRMEIYQLGGETWVQDEKCPNIFLSLIVYTIQTPEAVFKIYRQ